MWLFRAASVRVVPDAGRVFSWIFVPNSQEVTARTPNGKKNADEFFCLCVTFQPNLSNIKTGGGDGLKCLRICAKALRSAKIST